MAGECEFSLTQSCVKLKPLQFKCLVDFLLSDWYLPMSWEKGIVLEALSPQGNLMSGQLRH